MKFEWNEVKRATNLRKHGIDFTDCEQVFQGATLTVEDDRHDYGEMRLVTFGLMKDRLVTVVHTEFADTIRIISIRKATRHEHENYFKHFAN